MDFDQDWFPPCTECGTTSTDFDFDTGAWCCHNPECPARAFYLWRDIPNIDPTEYP